MSVNNVFRLNDFSPNDNKLNYLIQIADILINNGGNRLEIRMRESRHDISLTNLGR